eukprot:331586-Chlamydomonas_euryale.AAC.3
MSQSAPHARTGVGLVWGGSGPYAMACALCDSALPAVRSPLPCYVQHRHTLRGSVPCNSDSDSARKGGGHITRHKLL